MLTPTASWGTSGLHIQLLLKPSFTAIVPAPVQYNHGVMVEFTLCCIWAALNANRKSHTEASFTLVLAYNLRRLKSLPPVLNLILMVVSSSPQKASDRMAENIMLNSVGASTQPCWTPLVTRKGSVDGPVLKQACHHGPGLPYNEIVWTAKLLQDPPKPLVTDSVECLGKGPWTLCKGPYSVPGSSPEVVTWQICQLGPLWSLWQMLNFHVLNEAVEEDSTKYNLPHTAGSTPL